MAKNPHLPDAPADLTPSHTRQHRVECGPAFHQACLEFAQSLSLQGKPAQAILQLNKAVFSGGPFPYAALKWFLENSKDRFIGNPVRHFQHLATRISGPQAEQRRWQAWACFHLSKATLPGDQFPPDLEQIALENVTLPPLAEVLKKLPRKEAETLHQFCRQA